MDVTPPTPPKTRRFRPALWLIAMLGILLLAAMLLVAVSLLPEPKVVWLSPAGLNGARQPAALARIKLGVARLLWPMMGRFWQGKSSIRIDGSFVMLTPAAAEQTGLGPPFATNSDGARIWILPAPDLASFNKRLATLPGTSILSKPRIQTGNGTPAVMTMGVASNNFIVDLTASSVSDSIKLTIGAIATEQAAAATGNLPSMKTNLAAACRVRVPNGGGFIVTGSHANDGSGNTWWFIASPVQVDPYGNPIKR